MDTRRLSLWAAVVLMVALTESSWLGLYDSTALLFGWLPAQLAYDIGYTVLALPLLYGFARRVPDVEDVEQRGGEGDA